MPLAPARRQDGNAQFGMSILTREMGRVIDHLDSGIMSTGKCVDDDPACVKIDIAPVGKWQVRLSGGVEDPQLG
jgi:hypothetical protein